MPQQHPLGRGQEKILLVTGTGGVALVGLFALQSLVQAQDQDHHVAVLHQSARSIWPWPTRLPWSPACC